MTSRRQVIGHAGLVATLGVAGCTALLPDDVPTIPERGGPRYRDWIPSAAAIPDFDGNESPMQWGVTVDVARLRSLRKELPTDFYTRHASLGRNHHAAGMAFGNVDLVLASFGPAVCVMTGDVDRTAALRTVENGGYERTGTHRGYALVERQRSAVPTRRIAVGDDAVVWHIADSTDPKSLSRRSFLRTMIDARDGRVERSHERDPAYEAFTDHLGLPLTLSVGMGYTSESRGLRSLQSRTDSSVRVSGYSTDVADGVAYRQVVAAFSDAEAVDTEAFRSWISAASSRRPFIEDPTVFADGPLAVAVDDGVPIDLGDTDRTAADLGVGPPPMATIDCTREGDTIRLDHRAGDRLDLENVEFGGGDRPLVGRLGPGESVETAISEWQGERIAYEYGNVTWTVAECRDSSTN